MLKKYTNAEILKISISGINKSIRNCFFGNAHLSLPLFLFLKVNSTNKCAIISDVAQVNNELPFEKEHFQFIELHRAIWSVTNVKI